MAWCLIKQWILVPDVALRKAQGQLYIYVLWRILNSNMHAISFTAASYMRGIQSWPIGRGSIIYILIHYHSRLAQIKKRMDSRPAITKQTVE
jgi:hypothetical protein